MARNLSEKEASIFDAHLLVLEDNALIDDVEKEIKESGENVEQWCGSSYLVHMDFFNKLEDELPSGKVNTDLNDISREILRTILVGETAAGTVFLGIGIQDFLISEDLKSFWYCLAG